MDGLRCCVLLWALYYNRFYWCACNTCVFCFREHWMSIEFDQICNKTCAFKGSPFHLIVFYHQCDCLFLFCACHYTLLLCGYVLKSWWWSIIRMRMRKSANSCILYIYDGDVNLNMQTHDFMQIEMKGIHELKQSETQSNSITQKTYQNDSHFFNLCTTSINTHRF